MLIIKSVWSVNDCSSAQRDCGAVLRAALPLPVNNRLDMEHALTDRQTVAGVLVVLVRTRAIASGGSRTSRTGLQASVPVNERPGVRRGIDALLDLGVLAMSGEDIGITTRGKVFLAHVQGLRGETPTAYEHDDKTPAVLEAILAGIDADDRFTPPGSVDDIRTLPARLEGYRASRAPRFSRSWIVMGGLAAAAAAFALLR